MYYRVRPQPRSSKTISSFKNSRILGMHFRP